MLVVVLLQLVEVGSLAVCVHVMQTVMYDVIAEISCQESRPVQRVVKRILEADYIANSL